MAAIKHAQTPLGCIHAPAMLDTDLLQTGTIVQVCLCGIS